MLSQAVDSYLALRRAAGFQLRVQEALLRSFVRFASERGEEHVRLQTAINWAKMTSSTHQRRRRLESVRLFARHAHVVDERHEVPPVGVFCGAREPFIPFIFTQPQLHQLLEAAAALHPVSSLRPWTYCTLFSLLAATGMRISEALRLRFDDVTPDGLRIRDTKYRKSRLVPLHPTALVGLERYLEHRNRFSGFDDHLFVSLRGRPYSYATVNAVFSSLVRGIGLHPGPGHRGPRIHDLRHSFAVRVLENGPDNPDDATKQMLALSTYMGHAKIVSTYWYLHATPHLLGSIAKACERHVARRGTS